MRRGFLLVVTAVLIAAATTPGPVAAAVTGPGTPAGHLYVNGLVSDDVTIFNRNADGSLAARPRHVPTGGGSRGIVIAPGGRMAFVAVGFDPSTGVDANKVVAFRVQSDGGLEPIGSEQQANQDPVSLAMTPDGRNLYVTNRGSNTISVFTVAADGSITQRVKPIPSGGNQPLGCTVTPDGRFLYVGHRGADGTDVKQVTRFRIGPDGVPELLDDPAITRGTPGMIRVSRDGGFLYVPAQEPAQIYAYRIATDGRLLPVPGSPVDGADRPVDAIPTPDGRHLYVAAGGILDSGSRKVIGFDIDADGSLHRLADFTAGMSPVALAIPRDGRHLYVSNIDSDDVSAFDILYDGRLRPIKGSPFDLDGGEQPALQALAVIS